MDLHSGSPFWVVRDRALVAYPTLDADTEADVAIIGAGVTGALCAYELTKAGASVVVLDKQDPVSGSSAATSGLLLYDTDVSFADLCERIGRSAATRVYQIGIEAIDRIEYFSRGLDGSCGFARRPSLYLASRLRHVEALRTEFEERAAMGLDVVFLERPEIERRYSFSAPAAIYSRGTAEIDCYRFSHSLFSAAQRAGARIYRHAEVRSVTEGRSGVVLTVANGCTIHARMAVYATGYETCLPQPEGAEYQLASTWVVVTEALADFPGWRDRALIWETARPYMYIRATDDNRLLIGGEDEPFPLRHRSHSVLARKTARLLARARRMFPHLPLTAAYAWAGTFATTADGLPYIGEIERQPGVWIALGYGGNGITFAAIAARTIADACLGRPNRDAQLFGVPRRPRTIADEPSPIVA